MRLAKRRISMPNSIYVVISGNHIVEQYTWLPDYKLYFYLKVPGNDFVFKMLILHIRDQYER